MRFVKAMWDQKNLIIAVFAVVAIALHLTLETVLPLQITFLVGGIPLLWDLIKAALKREYGSDLLAGISIITSLCLGEYLAGSIVILMLSGGQSLENYAAAHASSALKALAKRIPSIAHQKINGEIHDVPLKDLTVNDIFVVYPHETCPVDGNVIEGHGHMDESYLTGEPFRIEKTIGSAVLSGSINGEGALTICASKRAENSRYAAIMKVMRESEQTRPRIRRLADQLGAFYTPLALFVAIAAWIMSGDPTRFLAVLVVATPCPLLIAIPIAIIGSISLSAKRAIIVKTPLALEQISECRTAIFDKTGTLTYGEPKLIEILPDAQFKVAQILALVASLERYSKHPLSSAILNSAKEQSLELLTATEVHEPSGQGLTGIVDSHQVQVTSRKKFAAQNHQEAAKIPATQGGLECLAVIDGKYAGLLRFHDAPRDESKSFVSHLGPKHSFDKIMIITGDRESEANFLAKQVGIEMVYSQKSPEEKLQIVRQETKKAKTLYVGDGINDAPAMMAATVGIAMGQNSEVTAEAASAVVLDNSLTRVDEFIHISRRMRAIALQSAVGGMALSAIGMALSATGHLSPVQGAVAQEIIDVLAIVNALRAASSPSVLTDFH